MSADPTDKGGSSDPCENHHDDSGNRFERDKAPKPYSFSRKVLLGIGVIIAIAAVSTIAAMIVSTSPQIHLSQLGILGGISSPGPTQKVGAPHQHIDKRFVLTQKEYGWNGTIGGPTIVVNKGDVVQINVINGGSMAHNFGIAKLSDQTVGILQQTKNMPLQDRVVKIPYNVMAAIPCPGCKPVFTEGRIDQFMQPDTQKVTTFIANEAGNFKYFCQVRGHMWLGMVGDLIVQDVNDPAAVAKAAGQTKAAA